MTAPSDLGKCDDNLEHLRFKDLVGGELDYTVSPVIIAGVLHGYAVGLWANRVRS